MERLATIIVWLFTILFGVACCLGMLWIILYILGAL